MVNKCFYCSCQIEVDSVVGMCKRCMLGVWGEKMSQAIIENMERESKTGNLELGRVSEQPKEENKDKERQIKREITKEVIYFKEEVNPYEKMRDLSYDELSNISLFDEN